MVVQMAEDLGHFTPDRRLKGVWDPSSRSVKILHPDSNSVIASLSYDAAEDLGRDLVSAATVGKELR